MATYTDKFSSGWATLILVVTRDSYSIANNTSKLECVLKIRKDSSCSSYSSSGASISMTIAGTKLYSSSSFDIRSLSVGSTKTLATKYITVKHNSDGTKSVSCKASFKSGVGLGSASISETYKCGDIPRKSTLSVSNGTLGVKQTLKITEKADSFKHKLKYTCGSKSGYILGGSDKYSDALSTSWTAPLSLASQSTTSKSVSIKFTLYTYTSGGSSVGSNEYTKTFTIPNNSSTQPEISNFEISDATAYYSTYGGYIQGKSKIKATITATGKHSATISEYATTVDGKTYKGSSITSDILSTSGGQTVSAKVTDSRGISKSSDPIAIEVLEYKNPSIILTVFRVDENGNKKDNGAYLQCNYNLDYSSFNGNNKVTITVYGVPGNSYELAKDSTATSGSKTFEADPDMAYKVYAIVTDSLGGQGNSATTTLLGAERIINIFPDGTGIAFGKKAEKGNLLESKHPIKAPSLQVPGILTGTVLFTNESGTTGTITLSESVANFTYLEIFYSENTTVGDTNSVVYNSVKVYNPDGKVVEASIIYTKASKSTMYIKTSYYLISGSSITKKESSYAGLQTDSITVYKDGDSSTITPSDHIKVYKVLGYK